MGNYSKLEEMAMRRRELTYIDAYPNIVEYHKNDLLRYFDQLNLDYLVARKKVTRKIDSKEKAADYVDHVRATFARCLGELPRTDAKGAVVTETIDRGTYLIDKVLIETDVDFYVSANFYYPKNVQEPKPAILLLCGHAPEGKASVTYVSMCVEAVLNGFCVLATDPLGQGERKLLDPQSEDADDPWLNAVAAHTLIGHKLALMGEQAAQYFMWENVRAVDYLLTRPEVDADRIGVTGNSGGGNMTAYMGAFDDRINAFAPSCYITGLYAMLSRILAQDSEQCLIDFMKSGLDLSDLITAAAPKPYFIGSALFDFFPIDGTRDAYVEAKKMYRLLGANDNLGIHIAPQGHGYWFDTRANILQFFCEHFNVPFIEQKQLDYEQLPVESELLCGVDEASKSLLKKSIFDLISEKANRKYAEVSVNTDRSNSMSADAIRAGIMGVLKMDSDTLISKVIDRQPNDASTDKVSVADISFYSEQNMRISATLYEVADPAQKHILVHVGEHDRKLIMHSIDQGEYSAVLCIEPRGTGNGSVDDRSTFGIFHGDIATCHNAQLLGLTMQGMRVLDVMAGIQTLVEQHGTALNEVTLYGKEEHALTALFAAYLKGISRLSLCNLLKSYRLLLDSGTHRWSAAVFVHGLLDHFDIDNLIHAFPGELVVDHRVDHMKATMY